MAIQVAPLGLRLFLEGIETPVVSAQVNIQRGQAAAATIQIVPTDSSLLLLPRTLVHLFYLDNEFLDPTNVDNLTTTARDGRGRPVRIQDDQNRFQAVDEQYKLLFSGEVIGYNYTKTPTSRAMVLQCLDFSSYWDTCYQWFAEFAVGGSGLTDVHHNFVGAGGHLFNDVAAGTRWVIGNILNSKPENPQYKDLTGLLSGYVHLLEVIGGLRPKKGATYKSFRGVNDFFTIAELMYNLSGMIGAVQSDKTSARMFGAMAFRNWLRNGMASAGSLISFRDVLKLVGQYIFHDTYPNPAAFYVGPKEKFIKKIPKTVLETNVSTDVTDRIDDVKSKIQGVLDILSSAANPINTSLTDTASVLRGVGETLVELIDLVEGSSGSDSAKLALFIRLARRDVVLAQIDILAAAGGSVDPPNITISQAIAVAVKPRLETVLENLDRVLAGATVRKIVEENLTEPVGEHLYNQLILPETFFVAPPRCNVLFPDMYFSFNYSRNFLREVSRLMLQGGLGMIAQGRGSGILGRHYVAPNIRDVNDKMARRAVFAQSTTILPHERHSGIVPKFEWVSDGHRWGVNAAKGAGKLTKNKKISYIQRLANYQFFIHRWMARSMNAQARFNPHLVIGFPGVVIDRATPDVSAITTLGIRHDTGRSLLPTAYVGKIATMQHSINQSGGTTSIAYTQARTHRGLDDEFLGVIERESKEETTEQIDVVPDDLINAIQNNVSVDELQLFLIQLWIKGRLVENTDISAGTLGKIEGLEDPNVEFNSEDVRLLGVTLDDIFSLRSRQLSRREELDDPDNGVFLPSSLKVALVIPGQEGKYTQAEGALPFEECVRPGWYAPDVWNNLNISTKVYAPLLGTTAITDDQQVGDPTQFADLVKAALSVSAVPGQDVIAVESDGPNLVLKIDGITAATIGLNLETGTTTETAIDGLTLLYGIMKKKDLDVQAFIDDYVKRPVANMVEILGDSDFQLDENGEVIARPDGTIPFEGFHSRGFGPYNVTVKPRRGTAEGSAPPEAGEGALRGLIPQDQQDAFVQTGTIVNRGKKRSSTTPPIPSHLDPRGRAQARVRAYVDELAVTRGILAT